MLLQLILQDMKFAQPGLRFQGSAPDLELQQFLCAHLHLLVQCGDGLEGGLRTHSTKLRPEFGGVAHGLSFRPVFHFTRIPGSAPLAGLSR